jgi:hypothetical protein
MTAVALTMTQFMALALSLPGTVDTVALRADGFLTHAFVHLLAGLPQLQTLTTERLDVVNLRWNLSLLPRLRIWSSSQDKWSDTQASSSEANSSVSLQVLELCRPSLFLDVLRLDDFPRLRRLCFRARKSTRPILCCIPDSLQEVSLQGCFLSPKAAWESNMSAIEGTRLTELVLSCCFVTHDVFVGLVSKLRLRRLGIGLRLQTDTKGRVDDLFGWTPEWVELTLHRRGSWRYFCSWLSRNRWDHTRSLSVLVENQTPLPQGPRAPVWQALSNLHNVESLSLECEPTVELLECCCSWMPKLKRLSMLDPVTGEPCIVRPRRPDDGGSNEQTE